MKSRAAGLQDTASELFDLLERIVEVNNLDLPESITLMKLA